MAGSWFLGASGEGWVGRGQSRSPNHARRVVWPSTNFDQGRRLLFASPIAIRPAHGFGLRTTFHLKTRRRLFARCFAASVEAARAALTPSPRTRRRDRRVHPQPPAPQLDDRHADGREYLKHVQRLRLVKRPDLAFDHLRTAGAGVAAQVAARFCRPFTDLPRRGGSCARPLTDAAAQPARRAARGRCREGSGGGLGTRSKAGQKGEVPTSLTTVLRSKKGPMGKGKPVKLK